MSIKNYYDILGVKHDASQEDIKYAYRKLSMKFHPDQNNGDTFWEEMFKSLNEANEILSNIDKRRVYDQKLKGSTHSKNGFKTEPKAEPQNEKKWENNYYQDTKRKEEELAEIKRAREVVEYLKKYFDKEEDVAQKTVQKTTAESIKKPSYISFKLYFWSICISSVMFVVINIINKKQTKYENIWKAMNRIEIHESPDNKSKILATAYIGQKFTCVRETKYFIEAKYYPDTSNIKGFILKEYLIKIK